MTEINPLTHSQWDGHKFNDTEIACGRCKFWHNKEDTHGEGECRRSAPQPARSLDAMIAEALAKSAGLEEDQSTEYYRSVLWPRTTNYDWCGDFSGVQP